MIRIHASKFGFVAGLLVGIATAQAPTAPAQAGQKPAAPAPAPAAQKPVTMIPPLASEPADVPYDKSFRKGVMLGRVTDLAGKPIPGATVALVNSRGKVLGWSKTDAGGEYRIGADPKYVLNLDPSRSTSLLKRCAEAVGCVVETAAGFVVQTAVSPGQTVHGAAVAVAGGTSGKDVVEAGKAQVPNSQTVAPTEQAAGAAATDAALSKGTSPLPPPCERGQCGILVSASGFRDASVADAAYWLEPPDESGDHPCGVKAALQTIRLAPAQGSEKDIVVVENVKLADASLEPLAAPAGSDINVKVKLISPDADIPSKVRVFARMATRTAVAELLPSPTDKSVYVGWLHVDKKTPAGPNRVCIGALRVNPIAIRLRKGDPDALIEFVKKAPDMLATQPYGYDPFVMASLNRPDLTVTILPAGK